MEVRAERHAICLLMASISDGASHERLLADKWQSNDPISHDTGDGDESKVATWRQSTWEHNVSISAPILTVYRV